MLTEANDNSPWGLCYLCGKKMTHTGDQDADELG